MILHSIRLRGPWELQGAETSRRGGATRDGQPPSAGTTIQIPDEWPKARTEPRSGPVRLARRFGCPTGLTAGQQVVLRLVGLAGAAEVMLNGTRLGQVAAGTPEARFEITRRLEPRNQLVVLIDVSPSALPPRDSLPALFEEVLLDIVAAA